MPSATIKLFLPHGDPKRPRTAEISNWSGKAVAAPRTEFDALLDREEMGQSGVYVLTGSDRETGNPMAYVGEAEALRDRIKSHKAKDFWVSAVTFLSKDENLTTLADPLRSRALTPITPSRKPDGSLWTLEPVATSRRRPYRRERYHPYHQLRT